jgi:serine/alanine adding enzyme
MYKFKKNISIKEYDEFYKLQSEVSFMQDYRWAIVKNNFKNILCGIYDDDKLVAVFSVLVRNLKFNLNLIYIPRGPILDFTNLELVKFYELSIKQLAKEHKAYAVKMEPNFLINKTSVRELELNNDYVDGSMVKHGNILKTDFKHKGFTKKLSDTFQPRYDVIVPLADIDNNILTMDQVLKSYKSKVRHYMGNFHTKRGVYFKRITKKEDLKYFMEMLNETEKRQSIHLRKQEYFENIMDTFKDDAYFLLGYVDLEKYLDFLNNNNGKEEEINLVKEKLEISKDYLLCSSLTITPKNEGLRMSEYIYAGNNLTFPRLFISGAMIYDVLSHSIDIGCQYCNLGGIDGNMNDGLFTYKSKYNSIVFEYAGEYNLVINKLNNFIVKIGTKIVKCLRKLK